MREELKQDDELKKASKRGSEKKSHYTALEKVLAHNLKKYPQGDPIHDECKTYLELLDNLQWGSGKQFRLYCDQLV